MTAPAPSPSPTRRGPRDPRTTTLFLAAASLSVFAVDLALPAGALAPSLVYPLIVFASAVLGRPRITWAFAFACTALILIDVALHGEQIAPLWVVALNRTSVASATLGAAALATWVQRERARRSDAESTLAERTATLEQIKKAEGELRAAALELERRSAEQVDRIRHGESHLQAVLDTASEAIVTIDDQGRIEGFNRAAERIFGWSASEALGRNVSILMPEPYRSEHDGYLARFLATREAHVIGIGRELVGQRKDGTTFPLELGVGEARIEGRSRFTGILRDLTEKKRLEEQFRQAQKMEAIGRLASGVAHDFNNLLMGIIGCTTLVKSSLEASHPARSVVDEIEGAATRGASLSRTLLDYGRHRPGESAPIRLNDAVGISERMLRRVIGEDVHLVLELCRSGAPIVGDAGRIEQVLLNLAVNARDAMPGGGRLRIGTRDLDLAKTLQVRSRALEPGRYVVLEVEDTGSGMDANVQQRAFEPFFTTKPVGTGTGLGLYTVYSIVGQLGGAIDLASAPGRGTRLTMYFPRAEDRRDPAPAAPAGRAAATPAPAAAGKATVLVVEDERLIRVTLRHLLTKLGFQVLIAEDGEKALEVEGSHAGRIDLLLSDIVLPRSSGPEVAAVLTARRKGLKVLFMSAYPAHVLVEQGRVPAGTRTLEKPFEERQLVEALEDALGAGDP